MIHACFLWAILTAYPPAIDQSAVRFLKEWNVPGCVVVIVKPGEKPIVHGYGTRDGNPSHTCSENTVFPLASCTKAFTAFLVGTLVAEGKLAWDDPVRKYLPDFRLSDPNASALLSVRDLLCHRTGVGSHDFLWYKAPWNQEESIRRVQLLPLEKPFRGAMQYQTIMYLAAGKLAEKAGGKPWAELLSERVLNPAGIDAALTTTAYDAKADRALGFRTGPEGRPVTMAPYPIPVPNAAGSLCMDGIALARWMELVLNEGAIDGKRILDPAVVRELGTPQVVIPLDDVVRKLSPESTMAAYGLGWIVNDYRGRKLLSHAGVIDGFRAHIALLPEQKMGVAVMSNLHFTRMNLALGNELLDRLLGAPQRDWSAYYLNAVRLSQSDAEMLERIRERDRRKGTRPSATLELYAGVYNHPAYGDMRITVRDGELRWEWAAFNARLPHWQDDEFRLDDGTLGSPVVPFTLKEGKPASLRMFDLTFERK